MVLFVILGVVVLTAVSILGYLFLMLAKEGAKEDQKAVPLTDLSQLKKEFSPGLLDPKTPKVDPAASDVIPAFVPKVSLPIQPPAPSPSPVDDMYKKRAQELEEELRTISQKAEGQSQEAKQMIDTLTKENEALKAQQATLEQAQHKLAGVETEAENLRTENSSLQTQLDSTSTKVRLLEEEMVVVKMQMGEEIRQANAKVTEMAQEKETLIAASKQDPDEGLRRELEELKVQHVQLRQSYDDLEKNNQQAREFNVQLSEKIDTLQYELLKAKAQASGFERIGFNYKNQLEDFFKKINSVELTNEQLSQIKNRLEGLVEQVKSENEELIRKDRLSQFALEENRSKLISLERECEDLKARIQHNES